MAKMKEALDIINAVISYGKFIRNHRRIFPMENFDCIDEMEKYYKSLPLPEGMKKNHADFERILGIGWYDDKELYRLNNIGDSDLCYECW